MMIDEALIYLKRKVWEYVKNGEWERACLAILEDPKFQNGYGSSTSSHQHHCYRGGLVVHTAEVLAGALALAEPYHADKEILIVAAIWHDAHKIFEYVLGPADAVMKTEYAKLIGHPVSSAMQVAHGCGFRGDNPRFRQIIHCILSHHGRREWGAPVEPATVEAQILHYADMMSMLYGEGR